jgi:hypothetical protein
MSITQRLKRLFGTKIHESLTLTDFVTLLAEKPTRGNRKLFYQRLLFSTVGTRIPNPDGSIKAGTRATTADDNVEIPSTQDSDGNRYLFVFCNVPAMWAAFPHDTFAELDARVVLEMAQSEGMGVIVQNVLESAKPWVRVPKEDVTDILAGRYSTNTVVVPPDHKVVVVHAQAIACLGQVESGVWVADLGGGTGLDDIVSGVRQLKDRGWKARVLWIVQPIVMETPAVFDTVVSALDSVVRESRGILGHSVVAAHATGRHVPLMRRLKDLGVAVYHSGPHGECFVEVHKPEGIVAGMPGREFKD